MVQLLRQGIYLADEKVNSAILEEKQIEELLASDIRKEYSNWSGIDGYKRNLHAVYDELKNLQILISDKYKKVP